MSELRGLVGPGARVATAGRHARSVVYSEARDALLEQIAPLGFAPIPGCRDIELGGVAYRPIVCDLGPESVAGWLSALAARALPVQGTVLDEVARELRLDGRRVALTRLECDVLRHLRDREDQPVEREALLRDVWGTTGQEAPTWSTSRCRGCGGSWATVPQRWRPCAASGTACESSERLA